MSNIIIKISGINYNYIIKKMLAYNISFQELKIENNFYYLLVSENDYNLLRKIDYKKAIIFEKYKGIKKVNDYIKNNIEKITVSILTFLCVYLLSFVIYSVEIKTSDKELKRVVNYLLMDNNIKRYKLVKSYKGISKIKKDILNKYQDKIEWLEIEKIGSKYNIYIIEKIKNKKIINNDRCNYIAKKSGNITSTYASKGVLLVQENNYVKKGDILITGSIIYNDEIKKEVCASGKVYGEVWYKVEVEYPLNKSITKLVKTSFYNIEFNILGKKYKLFNNKYNYEKIKHKVGSNILGFNIYKNYKKLKKNKKYSEQEIYQKSIEKSKESLLKKLPKNSRIMGQNVLKKYINNGKMYLEVLLTVEEELGVVTNY